MWKGFALCFKPSVTSSLNSNHCRERLPFKSRVSFSRLLTEVCRGLKGWILDTTLKTLCFEIWGVSQPRRSGFLPVGIWRYEVWRKKDRCFGGTYCLNFYGVSPTITVIITVTTESSQRPVSLQSTSCLWLSCSVPSFLSPDVSIRSSHNCLKRNICVLCWIFVKILSQGVTLCRFFSFWLFEGL